MSTAANKPYITPERYLELEEASEVRHEYYRGEMFAMSGGTREHSLLGSNMIRELSVQLRGRPCEVHTPDMRLLVEATGFYTYPDASVVCGMPRFADRKRTTLLNPTVVVEVLSPSTERYDRGTKFEMYEQVRSIRAIVLVSQDRPRVDLYWRAEDGPWSFVRLGSLEDVLVLDAIECRIPLRDLYDRIDFQGPAPLHPEAEEPA